MLNWVKNIYSSFFGIMLVYVETVSTCSLYINVLFRKEILNAVVLESK